mgnify:CR=1 FL=1
MVGGRGKICLRLPCPASSGFSPGSSVFDITRPQAYLSILGTTRALRKKKRHSATGLPGLNWKAAPQAPRCVWQGMCPGGHVGRWLCVDVVRYSVRWELRFYSTHTQDGTKWSKVNLDEL